MRVVASFCPSRTCLKKATEEISDGGHSDLKQQVSVVTDQQQPQRQQESTITLVGLRLSNHWEPPPTTNSKLHDRV